MRCTGKKIRIGEEKHCSGEKCVTKNGHRENVCSYGRYTYGPRGGGREALNLNSHLPTSCDSNKLQVRLRRQFPPRVWKV